MDMSSLLNAPTGGPLSTKIEVCPEGEFKFVVDDSDKAFKINEVKTKDGLRHILNVSFKVLDDDVRTKLGRENVFCPMKIWLDLDAAGNLDMSKGKNVGLGRLMDAFGLNDGTTPPAALRGRGPVIGKVKHTSNEKGDIFAEVERIAKIG